MSEETKDGKISISESPRKVIGSVSYTLKVPNFFTLPEYDSINFELESCSFEFANRIWCFRFKSTETDETETDNSFKSFHIYIVKLSSEQVQYEIFYEIIVLDANDKAYSRGTDVFVLDDDEEELFLDTFDNDDPNYDTRETLTLHVHLICVESPDVGKDQASIMMDRCTSLSQDFKNVLLNGKDHNVTFSVRGKQIQAHQDILRARSEVFCSMLKHDMLEKNSGVIDVPDCDPEAFEVLVLYIYTGKVEKLDENNMFGLYYAADKYNIAHLKVHCREFIKKSFSVTNVCEAVELASKHSDEKLLNCAIDYFTDNADDIFPTVEWQLFMKENSTVANELIIKSFKMLKVTVS